MTEFIYKVASRGEGKTKWLLNQAKKELDAGEKELLEFVEELKRKKGTDAYD